MERQIRQINSKAREESWDAEAVIIICAAEARAHFAFFEENHDDDKHEPDR